MTDNELLLALSDMLDKKIQPVKDDVRDTRLILENDVLPRLQNLESCYTSTFNRYKSSVDNYEQIQDDITLLKKVVREHSVKLEKIS